MELFLSPTVLWALAYLQVFLLVAAILVQALLISGLLIDRARRRKAENEHKRPLPLTEPGHQNPNEERFAKAFNANPQPMSLTTVMGGRYLDVNESFLEMSGYTREELIGHTSLDLRIWETSNARAEFVKRLNELGSVVNYETK